MTASAVTVHRVRNVAASPLRYEMDGKEQYSIQTRSRTPGSSSARSTTRTRARRPIPSQTDVNLAKSWPERAVLIVGLEDAEPDVRAWQIVDGAVSEAALEVEDGRRIDA